MRGVVVANLGCANTASVLFALERAGATARLSADAAEIAEAPRLVLPGVGAAGYAMGRIHALGLFETLRAFPRPLIGLCLGQQLLFGGSTEGGVQCLGLIPGEVTALEPAPDRPIPHMGWNQLQDLAEHPLLEGVKTGDYVYFVHGFACPPEYALATTVYGRPFAAMAGHGHVLGCQFHPERSGKTGARILKNFVNLPC